MAAKEKGARIFVCSKHESTENVPYNAFAGLLIQGFKVDFFFFQIIPHFLLMVHRRQVTPTRHPALESDGQARPLLW